MVACGEDYDDVVKFLIKNDGDVKATDDSGHTPFMYTCKGKRESVCVARLLLKKGADVSVKKNMKERQHIILPKLLK